MHVRICRHRHRHGRIHIVDTPIYMYIYICLYMYITSMYVNTPLARHNPPGYPVPRTLSACTAKPSAHKNRKLQKKAFNPELGTVEQQLQLPPPLFYARSEGSCIQKLPRGRRQAQAMNQMHALHWTAVLAGFLNRHPDSFPHGAV